VPGDVSFVVVGNKEQTVHSLTALKRFQGVHSVCAIGEPTLSDVLTLTSTPTCRPIAFQIGVYERIQPFSYDLQTT
jgi:hypothetical protein